MSTSRRGKTLRIIAIVLMGVTAFFTIAGGLGTSCVAFNPTGFGPRMANLAPFQWLYVLFVVVTTAIGIMGARAVYLLAKGKPNAYRYSLIALILGTAIGLFHIAVSRDLRGGSMPVDVVVYTTVLTLIIFLVLRTPGIWEAVDHMAGGKGEASGRLGAAISMLVCGLLSVAIPLWAGPTHTWDGTNWAAAFQVTSAMVGLGLILGGTALLVPRKSSLRVHASERGEA